MWSLKFVTMQLRTVGVRGEGWDEGREREEWEKVGEAIWLKYVEFWF